jgi:hypothetical protein
MAMDPKGKPVFILFVDCMTGWIGKVSLWLFSQLHRWRDRIPKLVVIRDTGFAIGNNLFATGLVIVVSYCVWNS